MPVGKCVACRSGDRCDRLRVGTGSSARRWPWRCGSVTAASRCIPDVPCGACAVYARLTATFPAAEHCHCHSRFTLHPQDRIPVRRGDVIGIYFPRYKHRFWSLEVSSAVFTCVGSLGTPSRTGPLARKYLLGFPCSWSLRRYALPVFVRSCSSINNKIISLKTYFTTASWGPLKKKKIQGPWARAQCAHWLRRLWRYRPFDLGLSLGCC